MTATMSCAAVSDPCNSLQGLYDREGVDGSRNVNRCRRFEQMTNRRTRTENGNDVSALRPMMATPAYSDFLTVKASICTCASIAAVSCLRVHCARLCNAALLRNMRQPLLQALSFWWSVIRRGS